MFQSPEPQTGLTSLYGDKMLEQKLPVQVELLVWRPEKALYEHLCGGAVIGSLLVLTAAHCVADVKPRFLRIAIGQHRRNRPDTYEQTFRASSIIINPGYRQRECFSLCPEKSLNTCALSIFNTKKNVNVLA